MITFGNTEVFAKHDVGLAKNGLTGWPDGLLGTRFFRPSGQPVFWASNNGNLALVDAASGGVSHFARPAGLPGDIGYCSGGPILTSPEDASWIMINHAERYTSKKVMWSTIELTRSVDDGHSWQYLGCIIEPCHPFDDSNTTPCEIAGGAPLYVGENLNFYFREPQMDYVGRSSMAYVNAREFFAKIADGILPSLKKWTPDDPSMHPDAVGGNLAGNLPGLPMECNWQTVIKIGDKRLYYMVFCPWNDTGAFQGKKLYHATSTNGIEWNVLSTSPIISEPGFFFYPNLISMDYEERVSLSSRTYLYWMQVQNLQTVWPGMEIHRKKVLFS